MQKHSSISPILDTDIYIIDMILPPFKGELLYNSESGTFSRTSAKNTIESCRTVCAISTTSKQLNTTCKEHVQQLFGMSLQERAIASYQTQHIAALCDGDFVLPKIETENGGMQYKFPISNTESILRLIEQETNDAIKHNYHEYYTQIVKIWKILTTNAYYVLQGPTVNQAHKVLFHIMVKSDSDLHLKYPALFFLGQQPTLDNIFNEGSISAIMGLKHISRSSKKLKIDLETLKRQQDESQRQLNKLQRQPDELLLQRQLDELKRQQDELNRIQEQSSLNARLVNIQYEKLRYVVESGRNTEKLTSMTSS